MKKSHIIQFLLALLFGPLGLFYSNTVAGVVFLLIAIGVGSVTAGVGVLFIWPLFILVGFFTVARYNKGIRIDEKRHQELVEAAKEGRINEK